MPTALAIEVRPQEKPSLPLDDAMSRQNLPAEPNPKQSSGTSDSTDSHPMTAAPILEPIFYVFNPQGL